jgi:hypothetical protein
LKIDDDYDELTAPALWANYRWLITAIGTVFAAASLISLIQHWGNVELQWGFSHFVSYYRAALHPIFEVFIGSPIHAVLKILGWDWSIPIVLKDLWTLSFVGVGVMTRALSASEQAKDLVLTLGLDLPDASTVMGKVLMVLILFVCAVLGFGIVAIFVTGMIRIMNVFGLPITEFEAVERWMWMTITAAVAFYVANALVPQFIN